MRPWEKFFQIENSTTGYTERDNSENNDSMKHSRGSSLVLFPGEGVRNVDRYP